jgi:hypothetical protein
MLNLQARCSSETSVNFQRTTRRCIPEDSTPRSYNLFITKTGKRPLTLEIEKAEDLVLSFVYRNCPGPEWCSLALVFME